MNHSRQFLVTSLLALFAGALLASGCDKPTEAKPEEPSMPISNQRILSQAIIGISSSTSSLYDLYDDGRSMFFFRGLINNGRTIGKLTRSGLAAWSDLVTTRGLCVVPNNAIGLAGAVVATGGIDYDSDGYLDRGFMRLRGSDGTELSEAVASKPDTALWLNAIAPIDSLHFVAVGGATAGSTYGPYIAILSVKADSSVVITADTLFGAMQYQIGARVVSDPSKTTGSEFVCYVGIDRVGAVGERVNSSVCALRGPRVGKGTFHVLWTVPIEQPSNLPLSISDLKLASGRVYVTGSADAESKKISGGGYFASGYIASISTGGALNWLKIVSLSKYTEDFNSLCVTPEALYVGGKYGNYITTNDERVHGLALLSIFNLTSGNAIYHLAFGSKDYEASFNSIFVEGTKAYCGGATNQPISGGSFQAWLAEIRVDGLGAVATQELPELTPLGADPRNVRPPREASRTGRSSE